MRVESAVPQQASTGRVLWARVRLGLQVLVGVAIIAIGAVAFAAGDSAGIYITGFLLVGLGLGVVLGNVLRERDRPPEISLAVQNSVPATAVVRAGVLFALGIAMVAVTSLTFAAWAILVLVTGPTVWALFLAAVAIWMASVVVVAATGRYTAGGLWFDPAGLTYRSRGLQTTVSWDGIATVIDEPSRGYVALEGQTGSDLRHSHRAGPWHGEKRPPSNLAVLHLLGTALSPDGLVRIIEHYSSHPEARQELGTSASLGTFTKLDPER